MAQQREEEEEEEAALEPLEWDFDSDEIASIASEDLRRSRPNRWKGPASTWRTLTEEEQLLWRSMKQLRDRDLAVHLYNAFALNRQGKNTETAGALAVPRRNNQPSVWKPSRQWTAWPLKWEHTPHPDFLGSKYRADDGNDAFTYQAKETQPSYDLEEELFAVILRQAKDRFLRRQKKHFVMDSTETATTSVVDPASDNHSSYVSSPAVPSSPPMTDLAGQAELTSNNGLDETATETDQEDYQDDLDPDEPVIAADDELSSKLLRPSVRHILSQLEHTLRALHQDRLLWEEADKEKSEDETYDRSAGESRRRQYKNRATASATIRPVNTQGGSEASQRSGIPQHAQPAPSKAAHAVFPYVPGELPLSAASVTDADKDAAFERWLEEGDEKIAARQASREGSRAELETLGRHPVVRLMEPNKMKKKLAEVPPRDWKTIVRLAATAGFSPSVISRTGQRCADLFGEPLEVYNPGEAAPGKDTRGSVAEYQPKSVQVYISDVESDLVSGADTTTPAKARGRRRAKSSGSASSTRGRTSSRLSTRTSLAESQRSSVSESPPPVQRSPAKPAFWCPVPGCDRAREGFARRANLVRHMALVHAKQDNGPKSEDELDGAVHVNGFMRPVRFHNRSRSAVAGKGKGKRKRRQSERKVEGRGSNGTASNDQGGVGDDEAAHNGVQDEIAREDDSDEDMH
ncbi:hypothetical protein S7711_09335 [Stachybotrys chartarum IBT 7711]|uniref:Uncharacterized protein n=1 Tax=Stachybotrys chartarum (strain CBS 109288 / IBT 7711) TaxID=1280523 RepID=A0A084AHE1_STACB|nr:hypothetical protein S7711_09335 [Stachybotrys chartarum IBT 7711]